MSGAVVVTPSAGAAWATAWEQFEGIRKGLISLSLTNYDAAAVPQIASGSWIEAVGSIYKWTGDDAIVGAPTNDVINYITMVPSGVGASAILTPTWSDVAPTWSDAYQGWYSGTTRYAGGCYYDGANYPLKWVYTNRHAGPRTRIMNLSLVGSARDWETANYGRGHDMYIGTVAKQLYIPVDFENPMSIVTKLEAWTDGATYTMTIQLAHADTGGTATAMADLALSNAAKIVSDATITDPVVDEDWHYVVYVNTSALTGTCTVDTVQVTVTEIIRC